MQRADLNEEQREAFEAVLSGRNVLITGAGGCGKSFTIGKITQHFDDVGVSYAVTASTGAAAILIGGITLHRWAGIGLGTRSAQMMAEEINTSHKQSKKTARKNWRDTKVLIVDEVSMLDAELFDKLENVARLVRGFNRTDLLVRPFGGLQLVLCGDFAQLPPVKAVGGFCFQSKCWNRVILPRDQIELTQVVRQAEGPFRTALGEIRMGEVSESTKELLLTRVNATVGTDLIKPTVLLSLRDAVEKMNEAELAKIQQPVRVFPAQDTVQPPCKPEMEKDIIENANKNLQPRQSVSLKVGAQIMLIFNHSNTLVNGSRGVVIDYQGGWPVVQFMNGEVIVVTPRRWRVKLGDKLYLQREQIPLILAWAITIHKCQGATLDCVEIDISRCFEYGQAYVALSRVRSLEGLCLKGGDLSRITAHPTVKTFYSHLRGVREQEAKPKPKTAMKAYPVGAAPPGSPPRKRLTAKLAPIQASAVKREHAASVKREQQKRPKSRDD